MWYGETRDVIILIRNTSRKSIKFCQVIHLALNVGFHQEGQTDKVNRTMVENSSRNFKEKPTGRGL